MENKTQYESIFEWIKVVIQSSNHDFHFKGVDNLIELFMLRTGDQRLTDELKALRFDRWNEIHMILK